MLGCSDGMGTVETEMDTFMTNPFQPVARKKLALHGINHREIPTQKVNLQAIGLSGQIVEKFTEPGWIFSALLSSYQAQAAVQIPAGYHDGAARLAH